jgi:hypothetical protein
MRRLTRVILELPRELAERVNQLLDAAEERPEIYRSIVERLAATLDAWVGREERQEGAE